MFEGVKSEIRAVMGRDPAAKSVLEVILCYPGFHALLFHRVAHWFYLRRRFIVARVISQFARWMTGIEIHPGARIGKGLFIDHGMSVVIGETTEIGDNVTIYQGATLGGTGKEKGKRHPTIGNNVVISAGAKVLGSFTVGDYAKIGAGAVVLRAVPPGATVVGVPGRVVMQNGRRVAGEIDLDHGNLPDPEANMFECLLRNIKQLEEKTERLEQELALLRAGQKAGNREAAG